MSHPPTSSGSAKRGQAGCVCLGLFIAGCVFVAIWMKLQADLFVGDSVAESVITALKFPRAVDKVTAFASAMCFAMSLAVFVGKGDGQQRQ